ncbi:MAG: ABC transporter ATP-binding protein [Chloroflexi bacterium]|nr:ABC transporter ATP-binding protein [Chloroflexota bacterium]
MMRMGGPGPGGMARPGGGGPGMMWMMGEKVKLQTSAWTILKRLGGILNEYRQQFYLSLATLLAASALQMALPWATRYVVDEIIPAERTNMLWALAFALIGTQGLRYLLQYINRYTLAVAGQQLVYRMAQRLFEHIQRLSLRFYERQGTGDIISRTTNDINVLQQSVMGGAIQAAAGVIMMLFYGVVLALLEWRLAIIVFSTLPALVIASSVSAEILRRRYSKVQEKIAGVNAVLAENITGVRVSKAFAREGEQMQRFQSQNRENLQANMSTAAVQSVSTPLIAMISSVGTALVLVVGAQRVMADQTTYGTLVAFAAYLVAFYQPIEELIRVNAVFQQALAAAERIFQFLDERPDVVDRPDAVPLQRAEGHVRFEHVSFSYEPGKPVLQDIDVEARPGEMVALVGHTGSGKTTMVNLIARFYDPNAGRVTIDGRDLRDITLASLRSNLAVVLQETFLFSGSVRENIAYGRLEATEEEIVAAARAAYAHDFVVELPQGYDSSVGEGGVMLSRGQRQRIALARAILRDPRILILDEATSDIDTETEVLIQRALEAVVRGRTVFVIAHRLSTIRSADQIVVLVHGRIVERGRHEELLARGGVYRHLHDIQFVQRPAASAAGIR